jgi:hypothetical protein
VFLPWNKSKRQSHSISQHITKKQYRTLFFSVFIHSSLNQFFVFFSVMFMLFLFEITLGIDLVCVWDLLTILNDSWLTRQCFNLFKEESLLWEKFLLVIHNCIAFPLKGKRREKGREMEIKWAIKMQEKLFHGFKFILMRKSLAKNLFLSLPQLQLLYCSTIISTLSGQFLLVWIEY